MCLEDHEPLMLGENLSFQVGAWLSAIYFTNEALNGFILFCVSVIVVFISVVEILYKLLYSDGD